MAWSRIGGAKAGSADGDSVTTVAFDTSGADFLVVVLGQESAVATCAITDSKGNAWNALTEQVEGSGKGVLFWSRPTSVGSGHTFTATQAGSKPAICVDAWSGSRSSPFDQQNGAHSGAAGTDLQTGSLTPTSVNALIIAGGAGRAAHVSSIDSSFTLANAQTSSANNDTAALAYLVQSTPAAVNPTLTFSAAAATREAMIASFFPARVPSMLAVF
jgi:hypothetical protein